MHSIMKRIIAMSLFSLCALLVGAQANPYIARVYEFVPAPGQFTNEIPEYEEDDTYKDMILKVEDELVGRKDGMISLGAWGGYVTFGFDHPLVNVQGQNDLKIYGNAMYAAVSYHDTTAIAGSTEPGIVQVSVDVNGNDLPDDEWYELAGSEHNSPYTRHHYSVTYYRVSDDHKPSPDAQHKFLTDTTYIRYVTSDGEKGYIYKTSFHKQSYFPLWINEDSITFEGTRLRNTVVLEDNTWTKVSLYCLDWGYVDNRPNDESLFDLDWAVNSDGKPVNLKAVDFVRVYTGQLQQGGWLGDTSTEICGAEDLHPEAEMPTEVRAVECSSQTVKRLHDGHIVILKNDEKYTLLGTKMN